MTIQKQLCERLPQAIGRLIFDFLSSTGVMGSGYYDHPEGGSNFPCLTNNPKYNKFISGLQGTAAAIHSAEYESLLPGVGRNIHNHDVPCAVCYVGSRGSHMMSHATNECPAGWTREYHRYLMTSYFGQKHSSEFVCIDVDPEVVPGSQKGSDGVLLYVVEGSCGGLALPCKPYIDGYELTCVVCTK